jgi:glycosyltransferase involved in cell wall biosynthesis
MLTAPMTEATRPQPPTARPVVAVYRNGLLLPTETYIRAQGEALTRYGSYYVGMHRIPRGLELPGERVFVLNQGGRTGLAREFVYQETGFSPRLVKAIRRQRPALVHAHLGVDGAAALPLARQLGVPLVVTFHGFDATATDQAARARGRRYEVYLRRRETLKRETRLFIAVAQYIRARMLDRGFPESKVVVHTIGVDTELFRSDPTVAREPVVLFVGRLIAKKGIPHLIAAMREVQARLPEADLVLVGKGELQTELERQARELGVRARFLGMVKPEEVREWMNRARALCVPSVIAPNGDAEGVPVVAQEAMAMGLPVVGSESAGIPEAIRHGTEGFLAPEGDERALASHLLALLTDAPLWERMSRASLARVRDRFDLRKQTAALEQLYDTARESPGGS